LLPAVAVICGFKVIGKLGEDPPAAQEFAPYTEIFPEEAFVEKLSVIAFVLLPDAIVAPVGKVHVYPVAPETTPTL
jgi:hypothetical protein